MMAMTDCELTLITFENLSINVSLYNERTSSQRKLLRYVYYVQQLFSVYKWKWSGYVCASSLRRWSLFLLVGSTDPYNHTYYESFWWKLFKNHKRTQIQRQRQWQRQRQRQIHRQSAWKTQHMLYFWNPDDLLIPNLMIDTSPWSSCSRWSPWLPCYGHTISSTGPSVSPFRDFLVLLQNHIYSPKL